MKGVSPVLNEGNHLRVRLSKNALSIHFHQPIPCRTQTDNHITRDYNTSENNELANSDL